MSCFNLNKYMGTWYELMHYPSWFQRNDNYNTMAVYQMNRDGTINIDNSTIVLGQTIHSHGTGKLIADGQLRVDFKMPEITKLQKTSQFKPVKNMNTNEPNYVIDKIWLNQKGEYMYVVVTDLHKQSLYILSRLQRPPLSHYNVIMNYVVNHFDRDQLVQTPHY